MPHTIDWLIENEIILVQYQGVITADEFSSSLTKINALIAASPRSTVHIITDVGEITQGVAIAESVKIVRSVGSHPRAGWSITLREKSALIRMAIALARSLVKSRARTFDTYDDAVTHLEHFDKQLNWTQINQKLVASLAPELHSPPSAENNG